MFFLCCFLLFAVVAYFAISLTTAARTYSFSSWHNTIWWCRFLPRYLQMPCTVANGSSLMKIFGLPSGLSQPATSNFQTAGAPAFGQLLDFGVRPMTRREFFRSFFPSQISPVANFSGHKIFPVTSFSRHFPRHKFSPSRVFPSDWMQTAISKGLVTASSTGRRGLWRLCAIA